MASVGVDPAESGLPVEGIEGTIVGQWYLGNFDSHVDPAWPFFVRSNLGQEDGTVLRIYAASYAGATWLEGGTATVSGDVIESDEDSGIPLLSTLILVAD